MPIDQAGSSKDAEVGDINRIARDYAIMRMEHLESSDLVGVCEEDVSTLAQEFHTAQKYVLVGTQKADRITEFSHTISFDSKVRSVMARLKLLDTKQVKTPSSNLAKLPKINLKPFDGKLENWVSFKELYDSLIHNRDLPDVEKLHYLLSSVHGLAYDLIKNYPLTDTNYIVAYRALHKYYDRKRNIAVNYYNRLLNCEVVKNKSGLELERIHRTFTENLAILSKYSLPDQDFMLFQLIWSKLDSATREAYELQLDSDVDIPQYDDIMSFLEKRARALENCSKQPMNIKSAVKNKSSLVVAPKENCVICAEVGHGIDSCSSFLKQSPVARFQTVKEKRLCILCLRPAHTVKQCNSKVKCSKCRYDHHTLLHFEDTAQDPLSAPSQSATNSQVALAAYTPHTEALFSTAVVLIKNKWNKFVRARVLLDSASACNFITRSCANRLGLRINRHAQSVNGIGQASTQTFGSVQCELVPTSREFSNKKLLEASVLPTICSNMPSGQIDISSWHHIKGIDLADPEFYKPGRVDMLISVNILASALKPGLIKGSPGQPIAIPTIFGWILMGECTVNTDISRFRCNSEVNNKNCLFVSNLSLDNSTERFWELETVDPPKPIVVSKKEIAYENYMEACRRNSEGRSAVPLTFIDPQNKPQFSNSREIALKRFHNLERKFGPKVQSLNCRAICVDQSIVVRLCCAKSKVAPLRKRSIPRLKLVVVLLLSELVSSVAFSLEGIHHVDNVVAWSDSSVALTWIKSYPSRWKTFVANRVTEIQDRIPPDCWRHVSITDNPADHGSRGLLPADLVPCEAWWSGPTWLSLPEEDWPQSSILNDRSALEEQKILSLFTANNVNFIEALLNRFSSFRTIVNGIAYCFRYMHNLKNPKTRSIGVLSCAETNSVVHFLVRHVQESSFSSEIRALNKNAPNLLSKAFRKLCPFVDANGLLRVGGRLCHSQLSFDRKHPLLLPRDHRLTSLIIEEYHRKFLHPGPQTLQNLLAQEFWILSSKRAIRSVISSCVKCFRVNPRLAAPPLMGDLPACRIRQLKPFSSSAVDYAGPFDICLGRGRGVRTYKGYVCIFVCTATKAVHLELASELTSEAYLACLRRFIARRGRCSRLISDQGTNFVGASNLLKDLMSQAAQVEKVEFAFHPPASPHFSGLAEAGVKSMKTHLARVVGLQRLTYEEFNTVLAQIEALLNSRPLSPLSSDPSDLSVLTPGHFLTLEPLTILPEVSLVDTNVSVLHRWKLIQKMHQDFWKKWHLEYIHTLQQRQKWSDTRSNLAIGTLVLIVNEQCSPMKWKLGRVTKLHLGADNICRVVTLHTSSGECKRPVVKLCVLPQVSLASQN